MNLFYHSLGKRQLLHQWSFLFTIEGRKRSREREIQKVLHGIKEEECNVLPLSFPDTSSEKILFKIEQTNCLHMQILVKQVAWHTSKVELQKKICSILPIVLNFSV